MQVILLQDVDKVGYKHEVVSVRDGFGRNYLIPQKLALVANSSNLARLDEMKRQEEAREARKIGEYREIADKLSGTVIRIGAKAGASGKIFGSVTNVQLVQALKEQLDVDVERRKIELTEDVKELGTYSAALKLHKEVEARINFEVVEE